MTTRNRIRESNRCRALAVVVVVETLEGRQLLSGPYLIPATGASGAIFDGTRNRLYVPTSGGSILRYDLNTKALLSSWTGVGGSLGGGDITADGKAIYVADSTWAAGQSLVHKITIDTGAIKNLPYQLDYDDTARAVVISSDGKAWVGHNGQWGNIHEINVATDAYVTPGGPNNYGGFVHRGKDRSLVYSADDGSSPPNGYIYDAVTHAWKDQGWSSGEYYVAMSPDGKEIATYSGYIDRTGTLLRTHPSFVPVGYDPNGSLVYAIDDSAHVVKAYDRLSNAVKFSFPIATDISSQAAFAAITGAVTDNGHWLVLTGTAGVHIYDLTPYKPVTTGSIAGTVFNDLNGNAIKDSGEPGLSGRTVWIDSDDDKVLDSSERKTTTDASGNYKFSSVSKGSYIVREVLPSGWSQTKPSGGYGIHATVAAGQNLTGQNFGARLLPNGKISGTVFNDANANGKRDLGELGLGLWRVYLDLNHDGKYDTGDASASTDVNGNWSFTHLAAGSYVVRIVQNTGTATTTPSGGAYNISLSAGQTVSGKLFGEKGIA